jgi:hypothetical protein
MLNSKHIGVTTAVKAENEMITEKDGTKTKHPIYSIKLETSDIDYEELNQFSPAISTVLLSVQPTPFKSLNAGEMSGKYRLKLWTTAEGDNNLPGLDCDGEYVYVQIDNFSVAVKQNIPTYIFSLKFPQDKNNGAFLFKSVKNKLEFEFSEMER